MLKYKEEARANALKIEQVQTRFEHQLSAASERAEEAESQLAALLAATATGRDELQRLKEARWRKQNKHGRMLVSMKHSRVCPSVSCACADV